MDTHVVTHVHRHADTYVVTRVDGACRYVGTHVGGTCRWNMLGSRLGTHAITHAITHIVAQIDMLHLYGCMTAWLHGCGAGVWPIGSVSE